MACVGDVVKRHNILLISVVKFGAVVLLSLYTDEYWTFCGKEGSDNTIVDSCSSTQYTSCSSYCSDTFSTDFTVNDDTNHQHYSEGGFCNAFLSGECACKYWIVFKLVPIGLHLLQLVALITCLRLWEGLDPQRMQYDILSRYLQLKTFAPEEHIFSTRQTLLALRIPPLYSIFSFLELLAVMWVWTELIYTPIHCGNELQTSLLYYPLIMTMLDLGKLNVYMSLQLIKANRFVDALVAAFNFQTLVVYSCVTTYLAGVFVGAVASDLYSGAWCGTKRSELLLPTISESTTDRGTTGSELAPRDSTIVSVRNPMMGSEFGRNTDSSHSSVFSGAHSVDSEATTVCPPDGENTKFKSTWEERSRPNAAVSAAGSGKPVANRNISLDPDNNL